MVRMFSKRREINTQDVFLLELSFVALIIKMYEPGQLLVSGKSDDSSGSVLYLKIEPICWNRRHAPFG